MAQLTDEPVQQLRALQDTIRSFKCNKQSKEYFDELDGHLEEMLPVLVSEIQSMQQAAAFGQTLKSGQLKAFQVSIYILPTPFEAVVRCYKPAEAYDFKSSSGDLAPLETAPVFGHSTLVNDRYDILESLATSVPCRSLQRQCWQ